MEQKPWWKSKIIWANVISGLLEVAQLLTGTNFIPPGTLTIATNVLTIILRKFFSGVPIGAEPNK